MRKLQLKVLQRANAYEIKPGQRRLLESENYSVDYYSLMLSYFIRANAEGIAEADTLEIANQIYERFSYIKRNRRHQYRSAFLWYAVEYAGIVEAMVQDGNCEMTDCIGTGVLRLVSKYGINYDCIVQTVLKFTSNTKLSQNDVFQLIECGLDITEQFQDVVEIVERYPYKYNEDEHYFLIFEYIRNIKRIRKMGITLEEAEKFSYNYEKCLTYYFAKYFKEFIETYPYSEYQRDEGWYYAGNKDKIEKLRKLEITGIVDLPIRYFRYRYNDTGITFEFTKYSRICLYKDNEMNKIEFKGTRRQRQLKLFVMKDMVLMKAGYKIEKSIPVTLKKLAQYYGEDGDSDREYGNFLNLLAIWSERNGNYVFRDALPYIRQGLFLAPIGLNEILKETTLADALKKKYKGVRNWKRNNINLLYATIKAADYVNEKSKQKLLNYDDPAILQRAKITSADSFKVTKNNFTDNGIIKFLHQWYQEKLSITNHEEATLIYDYINMCLQMKEPINLGFMSIKKIKGAHDKVLEKSYQKAVPIVKIPADSKFNKLSSQLPSEFERITSRKRLIKESMLQHHCVWSYADQLNNDKSAIYSFIFTPEQKRYTIEFKTKGKEIKYYISQMQCAWDQGCSIEAYNYVRGFLT